MGAVLWRVGEFAKAQQVYEVLLGQETRESARGAIYDHLGLMKQEQGEYAEAIAYHAKSIEIGKKTDSSRRSEFSCFLQQYWYDVLSHE